MSTESDGLTKRVEENFRVIAYTDTHYAWEKDPKVLWPQTRQLEKEIKRHCDGFETLVVTCDRREICAFCGDTWSGCIDANGYPLCCGAAQDKADKLGIKPEPEDADWQPLVRKMRKVLMDGRNGKIKDDDPEWWRRVDEVIQEAEGA